jgi:hypothetical protein
MVDKTMKYHPEQVAAAIDIASATVFWELYEKNPKVMKKSLERYSTIITNSLVNSVYPPRYVAALTVDIVDLPKKAGGVLEVFSNYSSQLGSTTTQFVPVSTIEGQQLYGSESSLPDNVIGFSYTGKRIVEFWGSATTLAALTADGGVRIRAIQRFRSYGLTDTLQMPYGQDERIMELVRQYLGAIPPKDLVNDEADMQR